MKFLQPIVVVAWAMWFGGTMALFLFVSMLFKHDRAIAVEAAPRMFLAFEKYQLILAAAALTGTFLWRILAPSKWITSLFLLLALATLAAVSSAGLVTPKMERLRASGEASRPEFRKLHGVSMMIYTSEAAILLGAGLILAAAIHATRRKDPETAAEKEPQA